MARSRRRVVQVWVEPISDDPEAISASMVARAQLPAAGGVTALRRVRLFELDGVAPLLHRSTQFYNPHKERCHVRADAGEPPPLEPGEHAVLVWERDGERRPAAERWWTHETGSAIAVREGVAWIARLEPGADAGRALDALVVVRDRRHGLLCNPHAQGYRSGEGGVPLPWFEGAGTGRAPRRRKSS
jgi:hypothetical protein